MTGRDRLHPPYVAFVSAGAARAISKSCGAAAQDDTPITLATGLRSLVVETLERSATAGKGAVLDARATR